MVTRAEDIISCTNNIDGSLGSTKVEKALDCEFDLGELVVFDPNAVEEYKRRNAPEDFIRALVRDNTQLLFNALFEIPTEVREDTVVVRLPASSTCLPREKPCPKPKPLTKWEEFKRRKGLTTKKKEKKVWDEATSKWKPRYGYHRINSEKDTWIIPVPEGTDPMKDQFQLMKQQKKERIAKNEFQRLRNIQRSHKINKLAVSSVIPTEKLTPILAAKAAAVAKSSTASLGKFDRKLPLEKEARLKGKKRKFGDNLSSLSTEKDRALGLISDLNHKRPKFNFTRVVEKQMKKDVREEIRKKKSKKRGTRSSKKLGNKKAAIKMAIVNRLKGKSKGKGKGNKRR